MTKLDEASKIIASSEQITSAYMEGLQAVKDLFYTQATKLLELYIGEADRIKELEELSKTLNTRVSTVEQYLNEFIDESLSLARGITNDIQEKRNNSSEEP
jgi:hypothetical protein